MSEDLVPANPLDLAGRTLMFTPAGGGYSREVRALDWEEEVDDAERMRGPAEVELEHFRFPFAGREWGSFFYTRPGVISFGKPIPRDYGWPERFGTMSQVFDLLAITPMISALYKPHLRGHVQVSNLPDRDRQLLRLGFDIPRVRKGARRLNNSSNQKRSFRVSRWDVWETRSSPPRTANNRRRRAAFPNAWADRSPSHPSPKPPTNSHPVLPGTALSNRYQAPARSPPLPP